MALAVLRLQALHTIRDIRSQGRHDLRQYQPANADPSKSSLNQILVGQHDDDMGQIAAEKIGNQRLRKDARRAASFIFSATREAFEGEDGNLEQDKINEFSTRVMTFMSNKYGADRIISAVLHNDETTPHIHMTVLPLREDGSLSYKAIFGGGRSNLRQLHTEYAAALSPMGIERGQGYSPAKHESVKDYYKRVNAAQAAIPSQEEEEDHEDDKEFLPDKWLGYSGREARKALDEALELEREKAEKIRDAALTALAQEQESKRRAVAEAVAKYKPMAAENEILKSQLQAQTQAIAEAEKQAREAKLAAEKEAALRQEAEARHAQLETERIEIANAVLTGDPRLVDWSKALLAHQEARQTHDQTGHDDESEPSM